jgi:probable HAF family extracellular repeat protein
MKSRMICITAMVLFAALAIPVWLAAQDSRDRHGDPRYSLKVLGALGNTFDSEAHGLNNRGSVPGQSFLPNGALHAFFWRKGVMTDLGTLGGPDSFVNVANHTVSERNVVVGYSETATPDPNAENFCNPNFANNLVCLPFAWENGVMPPLPTLGGPNATAAGINNRRQIVGTAETANTDPCSFAFLQVEAALWQNGHVEELPPFPGDAIGSAFAINDAGQIVGASGCIATNTVRAVLWPNSPSGEVVDLGNLGGTAFDIAFDINNRGQVVGQSNLAGETNHHAFLWQNGVITDLGSLPGLPTSLANGINNQGQVVGFSNNGADETSSVAVLWQNGTMIDLNTVIPADSPLFLMEAAAINDRGQIAGWGRLPNGNIRPFLLTPCDEERAGIQDCRDSPQRPAVESGNTDQSQQTTLAEKMRNLHRRQLGFWSPTPVP